MWPLEAHDGGMSRDFYIDEQEQIFAVFEESLRNSKLWFMPLPTSIKHSILARLEKNIFFDKSVLEMSETSLYSLHEQFKPWISGITTNSPGAYVL